MRQHKKFDEQVIKGLLQDRSIMRFWCRYFDNRGDAFLFIKKCLKKMTTRRMMLHTQWYTEIADKIIKIKYRPALQIAFLIALAENIAAQRFTKKQGIKMGTKGLILDFFKFINESDKQELNTKFKRLFSSTKNHRLRISSIIKILYQVRNNVFHGKEFWEFFLVDKSRHHDADKPYWSLITIGWLGTRKSQRRTTLDLKITYDDLRDIFIRTAIRNIESEF